MQRTEAQRIDTRGTSAGTQLRRSDAVVGTLAGMRFHSGPVAEVAHDARNMVTALALYCDLLDEPGVLNPEFRHYANELRLVSAASRRVVEKLTLLDGESEPQVEFNMDGTATGTAIRSRASRDFFAELLSTTPLVTRAQRLPNDPIDNLQEELLANHNLLDAIAGTAIAVTVRTDGGARPVRLSSEDLTRVLVNLVKNAAEAMQTAGSIEISLRENLNPESGVPEVVLAVEDTGPGIPADCLEKVFEPRFTSHAVTVAEEAGWPGTHRGLGLSITRSIVEGAGGRARAIPRVQSGIQAANQAANQAGTQTGSEAGARTAGACIELELPIRTR